MINEEKLNKMYDGIIKGSELTTKELNSYGFNSSDLTDLISNNVLERIKRGHYLFLAVDDLFLYGKKLISLKEYAKANICLERCYELNPNHIETCLQLFYKKIKSHEYNEALKYLDKFYNYDNSFYDADSNFYLFLLSNITEIPEKYQEHVKKLEFADIRVDFMDKRYEDKTAYNIIRIDAFKQGFIKAFKGLKNLIDTKGKPSVQDIITKVLLDQAIEKQKQVKKEIITLINNKQYKDVIAYIENMEKHRKLTDSEECTLQLLKDLNTIITTGEIPEKQIITTDKTIDAIKGRDYELALKLSNEYLANKNIESSDNILNILLSEINKIIKEISSKEKSKEQELVELSTRNKEEVQTNKTPQSENIFADIINYLMNNDLDNSFTALKSYLESIKREEYEFLIIDLIKLSLVEHDIAFTKPMIALAYISRGNYQFNISEYIKEFYIALSQNMFEAARIYLDIIASADKLGQQSISTEGLKQALNLAEGIISNKENIKIQDKVDNSPKIVEERIDDAQQTTSAPLEAMPEDEEVEEVFAEPKVIEEMPVSNKLKSNEDFDVADFINQRLNELHENGIILLEPMDNTKRKAIHKYLKWIPDIVSFSIGDGEHRQVVLRHRSNEYIDITKIAKEGHDAYNSGNNNLCIEKFKKLLGINEPRTWIYSKLGLAYMKIHNKKMAIAHLIIATELAKLEKNTDQDYTELIADLKGLISEEDKKPRVRMEVSEFDNNMNKNYGINNLEEILELLSSGMSLEEVCESMNLSLDQKNIVALILAKDNYSNEDYDIGDMYLKLVEKSKDKSEATKSLFDEVRKNKKFYKYRKQI